MIRANYDEWGILDGTFVLGKRIDNGPPLTEDRIRKDIAKAKGKAIKRAKPIARGQR